MNYIFLFLCFVQLSRVFAYPKQISTPVHNDRLQDNLFKKNYSPSDLEVSVPSQLLKSLKQVLLLSSDIKPTILEVQKIRDDSNQSKKDRSLEDIVDKIRSHRFIEAEIMLRRMDTFDKIAEIVHNVYNSSESNIDLLLEFGRDLTKTELACSVLFALWNEMKTNGHRDVQKMIALVNAIDLQLTIKNESPEWEAKVELLANVTISEIASASVEILKAEMISEIKRNNTEFEFLRESNSKFDASHKFSDEVIHKLNNESLLETSAAVEIAQNLHSQAFLSQAISRLQELFVRLENANNLNSPAMLNIGEYLKHLKLTPSYVNLSKSKKETIEMMIQKMPICARNLFFEPFVCIWNKGKAEYLYAAGSEFNRNEDKRSVFTRTTGEAVGPGVWIVEKSGDEFFFRNMAYENEYLYAATGTHNKDSRFVHTWTEGGKVGNKSSWKIELEDDVCYLRNVNYDEYLFSSDRQSGDQSRYTFTWIPKNANKEENMQWQIRRCDMSEILRKGL